MKILGHRGVIVPEGVPYQNSLDAFRQALIEADGFETDVCVSADGDIFFVHEAKYVAGQVQYCLEEHLTIESCRLVRGRRLEQLASAEVRRLRLRDGSRIPEFEDVANLLMHSGKYINFEIKGQFATEPLIERLKHTFRSQVLRQSQVLVSSFNHRYLLQVRQNLPSVAIGALLIDPMLPAAPLFPWSNDVFSCYEPLSDVVLATQLIDQLNPELVVLPHTCATLETVKIIHSVRPQTKLIFWVYSEIAERDLIPFINFVNTHSNSGLLEAVIVDNPSW